MHKSEFLILSYVQCMHSLQEVWSFLNADFKFAAKPCTFSIRRSSAHTTINYQVPTANLPPRKNWIGGDDFGKCSFFSPYPSTASLWYKLIKNVHTIFVTHLPVHIYISCACILYVCGCVCILYVCGCVYFVRLWVCGCVWLADDRILH